MSFLVRIAAKVPVAIRSQGVSDTSYFALQQDKTVLVRIKAKEQITVHKGQ